jgi:hypothetical protein
MKVVILNVCFFAVLGWSHCLKYPSIGLGGHSVSKGDITLTNIGDLVKRQEKVTRTRQIFIMELMLFARKRAFARRTNLAQYDAHPGDLRTRTG